MALTKITTSVIAANTLSTANIADNSIDATKIASNSILTRHIDDDQITGDQLADTISIVTDLNVGNDLTVTGNLTVNGSTVTNSSTNTTIEDALIELGTGTSGSPSTDAGIVIERGSSDNVFIGWDESADKVTVGTGSFTGASSGNLTITPAAFVSGALTASGLAYPTSDGSSGQVIQTDGSGNLTFGNKASSSQVDTYATSGDGSTTAFDTGTNPLDEKNTWVFIDGVYQQKSTYSYSGSTITFATAPDNGAAIDVITGTTDSMSSSDTVLGVYEATTTATTTYTTGLSASNENNTWVFVGGVLQPKDSYTFSSGTLTFDAATPAGEKLSVTATRALTAGSVVTASIGANAVTSAKIASNSILSRHIANNSIVGADISATTGITASTFTGALTGNVTGNVTGNLNGLVYPSSDGTNGQALVTNGSGTLSFASVGVTGISSSADATAMTITSAEKIGIGDTDPPSLFTVLGTNSGFVASNGAGIEGIQVTRTTSSGENLYTYISTGTGWSGLTHVGRIESYGNNAMEIGSQQNQPIIFATNDSERVRIDGSGNVGIGTTSPEESLHVVGDVVLDDAAPKIYFQTGSTHYNWKVSTQDGVNKGFEIASGEADGDANSDTFTRRLVIEGDTGCVGIGMDDPNAKLDVEGTNFAGYALKVNNTGTGGANHGIYINTGSTSAYNIVSQQNGTTKWFNTGDHTWFDANFAIGHTTTTASSTNKAWTPQAGLSVKQGGISYNGTGAANTSIANYSQSFSNMWTYHGCSGFQGSRSGAFRLTIPDVNGAASSVGYGGFSVEIYLSGYSGVYAHCFVSGYVNAGITISENGFRATGGSHSLSYGSQGTQGFWVEINTPSYTHGCAYWRVTKGGNSSDAQWTKLDDTIAYWS